MKLTMPLHQFGFLGDSVFEFTDQRFAITPFKSPENLDRVEIYSRCDRTTIDDARHALVGAVIDEDAHHLVEDANLILISFRLLATRLSPYVRYVLHYDIEESSRWLSFFTFANLESRLREVYDVERLQRVDAVYEALRAADKTSDRIRNALSFLHGAFVSDHWVNAFVFLMSSIEALFSNDRPGGATRAICRRVNALLSDSVVTQDAMIRLYHIRSRILHGNIDPRRNAEDNLRELELLERVTCSCFRKLLEHGGLSHFSSTKSREDFLKELDKAA
jgi:hypothetical protein